MGVSSFFDYEESRLKLYACCGGFYREDELEWLKERGKECAKRCVEIGVVVVKKPRG